VRVLTAAALGGGGSVHAGFPASKAVWSSSRRTSASRRRRCCATVVSVYPFGLPLGIHGSVALSPDGTQAVMVDTVALFPGMAVPTLLVGDFISGLQDRDVGSVAGRPAWSPDGAKIAFAGNRSGNWDINVVALDEGTVPVDLTPASPAADLEPAGRLTARRSPSRATAAARSTSTR
jgi:WD40-like Beta Propeller Repeat